jgi:acyl-coenzyme A synthetase/AMP-(fatty) acid ligase
VRLPNGKACAARVPQPYVVVPRAVVFRSSLPRTETGKLQRFRLKQEPEAGACGLSLTLPPA